MSRVLVIGDTHCPVMIDGYVDFLKDIKKKHKTDAVVHIGDVVDFGAISFHEKNPSSPSPVDEYRLALSQVKRLYKAFPDAVVMTGNHDALPRRQARTVGVPVEMIRNYADIWETPRWDWRPRYAIHQIDGVLYAHGDRGRGGQNAAMANAKEHFSSWVQGHLHAQAGVTYFANENVIIFAMNVGCGIDRDAAAMDYGFKFNKKPIIGCGVVIDGEFGLFEPMKI